jgi:hypothetical protein
MIGTRWQKSGRSGHIRACMLAQLPTVAIVRGTSIVLSLLAISLSACASGSGTTGSGPDTQSPQYQRGYQAGQQARLRYGIRPGSTAQDLAAFCDETAYLDIQPMKGPLILWSEGFDAGCRGPLPRGPLPKGPLPQDPLP